MENLPAVIERVYVRARPNPFKSACVEFTADPGTRLDALAALAQPNPVLRDFLACDIGGKAVPPKYWSMVRPKAGARVVFHPLPKGPGMAALGGGNGNVLLIAGAVLFATGVFWPLGVMLIGAGLSAKAQSFLAPEPVQPSYGAGRPSYAITGGRNEVNPGAPVSELFGTFKFAPRHAVFPYTEIVGNDNYYRTVFHISAGMVTDPIVKIGETAIENFHGVETNFYRGWHADDINDQGTWNASSGSFPMNPVFGDHYTVGTGGTVDGTAYTSGQTITFNQLYNATTAQAWDVDQFAPLKIFTDDVYTQELDAFILNDWVERTTVQQTDEFAIIIQFKTGLFNTSNKGNIRSQDIGFQLRWSPKDEDNWTTVNFSVVGRQTSPLVYTKRVKVDKTTAENGQFDVAVRRTGTWMASDRTTDDAYFIGLQSYSHKGNVVPVGGRAFMEMRIKASDQLSGALDQVLMTATRITRDWNGAEWIIRPTNSPAAAVRAVYQDKLASSEARLPDSEIDLPRFQEWGEFCAANNLECCGYVEDQQSVGARVAEIMAAGRAQPHWRDGKYSVVWDGPKTAPTQIVSRRNANSFTTTLTYPTLPHAYRLKFWDRDRDHQVNEDVVVYTDGYTDANATDFESLNPPFVTSAEQAMAAARYSLASRWLRPEVSELRFDIANLVSERGDRIDVQDTAIGVGLGAGRVKSVTTNGPGGTVDTFTLDAKFELEDSTDYAAQVQLTAGSTVTYELTTVAGTTSTFTITEPNSTTVPAVGELVAIGEADSITFPMQIAWISPGPDDTAVLTCIPYNAEIYTWENDLPDYNPRTPTPRQLAPPIVTNIQSDIDVMVETPSGGLEARVVFTLAAPEERDVTLTILHKLSGTDQPYVESTVVSRTSTLAAISGVNDRETYDFRLIYSRAGYYTSVPTKITGHRVVGREAVPEDLANLSIVPVGQNVILTWDEPTDRDVKLGGHIEFRHVANTGGGTWQTSQPIGRGPVSGASTHTWLPAVPGTYLARVFDSLGIPSAGIASVILDKDHDPLEYSPFMDVVEHPNFAGQKVNAKIVGSSLLLETGDFDSVDDTDLLTDWDEAGQGVVVSNGTYVFDVGIDTQVIAKYRVSRHIVGSSYDENDRVDLWGSIDDRESIDGVVAAPADVVSYLRWTDDDPLDSPSWSAWQRFEVTTLTARAFEFMIAISNDAEEYQCRIDELSAKVEKLAA